MQVQVIVGTQKIFSACQEPCSQAWKNRPNRKLLAGKFYDSAGKIKKYRRETIPHWREICPACSLSGMFLDQLKKYFLNCLKLVTG